ncbi:hypothetical protein [Pseudomonas sp. MWU13-2100]|uniref:hypothetical protein n=1 Tax=Pseudomonas sp. MWU13-2100 TaxID=2935075 RepID=UPI00201088CB|nr:hypothetical protein [Pseudomonas sp. MWU13-2100]
MSVKLDKIPPLMVAPSAPRAWRWLLLLAVLLLSGLGLTLWLAGDTFTHQSNQFWLIALGIPFLIWCALSVVRVTAYLGDSSVAAGWNDEREADLIQKMRRGRRSQQVLAVSLHTALRERGVENAETQRDALQNGTKALNVQAAWQASEEGIRHSRLPHEQGELPDTLLRRVLLQVLSEIGKVLETLAQDRPLALLLEMNSGVAENVLSELWQAVWAESGIRQKVTRVEGSGLSVVDAWLDERIHDQALLLVVAFQLAPSEGQGTAEAVVGLLFGNRLTQTMLEPMAYLHRPEQEREPTPEGLLRATRQALDWVPVQASSIGHVWAVGADLTRMTAITMALSETPMPLEHKQGLHDLGGSLGHPGCAAPWVAIAAAVESIRGEGKPNFIFSGESPADLRLWCLVVMPPSVS